MPFFIQALVKHANPGAKADEIVSKTDEIVCTNSPELGLLTIESFDPWSLGGSRFLSE
jgi:hypothetical protein